jgi:hypothetical protein
VARISCAKHKLVDVSQEELAVLASLHRTVVSQLKRGLRIPHRHVIKLGQPHRTIWSRHKPAASVGMLRFFDFTQTGSLSVMHGRAGGRCVQ